MGCTFISVAIGLIAGNFIWQAATAGDWLVACDRSWFQAMALLAAWLAFVVQRA